MRHQMHRQQPIRQYRNLMKSKLTENLTLTMLKIYRLRPQSQQYVSIFSFEKLFLSEGVSLNRNSGRNPETTTSREDEARQTAHLGAVCTSKKGLRLPLACLTRTYHFN